MKFIPQQNKTKEKSKKPFLILTVLLFVTAYLANGQGFLFDTSLDKNLKSNNKNVSAQQLFDIANHYHRTANNIDSALFYYNRLISGDFQGSNMADHHRVQAYNWSALIYYNKGDYRTSYERLLKALQLSEISNDVAMMSKIYSNIGNIYLRFSRYDLAKVYYLEALNTGQDSAGIAATLNNLGYMEVVSGNLDSAFYSLNQSLQLAKRHNPLIMQDVLHSLASFYKGKKNYDSAYIYYQLSINEATKNNTIAKKAKSLSDMGKLFFEVNRLDSSIFYIDLSNAIATEYNFLNTLMENYLTLSKIAELKKHNTLALNYFKQHSNLKDSILNLENIAYVDQLQHLHEVSKINQQIEELHHEQRVKERTIYYQKIIQYIVITVLLLISGILVLVVLQKRKLSTAYNVLFEKNIEIIDLQKHSSEKGLEKYKKSALKDDMQNELLNKILIIMEDTSIICDTEFSIDKLSELLNSNHTYVSQAINSVLGKNFRSFLNGYRIREAQRLFLEPGITKYTIEAVALKVGFKSRNAFGLAFKEVTGVTPHFYLKLAAAG